MNALSHHIECLLLDHPCVVVPQFGAFVTLASPSVHVDHEALFFPPLRVVRFNPNVLEDDGLLVGSVRRELHCSESEAKHQVQSLVLRLRQKLLAEGQVDFGSIGIFQQDEDGHVTFSACQAGAITPTYFGLDAFVMHRLTDQQRHIKGRRKTLRHAEGADHESSHITIRISRRAVRTVALAAAAILLCVLFYSPVDTSPLIPQQATVVPTQAVKSEVIVSSKTAEPSKTSKPATSTLNSQPSTPDPQPSTLDPQPSPYCIVLASAVSQHNADDYVARLQKKGYKNARVHNNGKMNRVILDGYTTESEAYNENARLHRQDKEFANSWVMKL